MRAFITVAIATLLSGVVLATLYWPGLHGDFFFDDGPSILQPEGLRIEQLSIDALHQALRSGDAGPTGRPIAQLSFAINYYFSHFNPFTFKATNLAIHLACAILVFFVARHIVTSVLPQARQKNILISAGLVSLLWLLHPIQALPVLHVVQRMTSLSALFLLAAFLLHIHARNVTRLRNGIGLLVAWCLLWPLAIFSKETALLFPIFVLAWELVIRRATYGRLDNFAYLLVSLTVLGIISITAYVIAPTGQWLWDSYDFRPFSITERLLTEGRILWFYLYLIFFPRIESLGLYHDDIPISDSLLHPWTTMPALAGILGLAWVVWLARKRMPIVSFGIAWFLIGHLMESTALPLELAHEHRNYTPVFGILIVCGYGMLLALESTTARKNVWSLFAITALAYLSFTTALRADQFGNELRRTQLEAQHHRHSSRAQYEAGYILAMMPEASSPDSPPFGLAAAHFDLAAQLDPISKMAWLGLIQLNCNAGKPVEKAWLDSLANRLLTTPFAPADRNVLYAIKEIAIAGDICLKRSDIERLFTAALHNPTTKPYVKSILHSWLADYYWLSTHDLRASKSELQHSLALVPHNQSNRLKLAQVLFLQRDYNETSKLLDELTMEDLTQSEAGTVSELKNCLAKRDPSSSCSGI